MVTTRAGNSRRDGATASITPPVEPIRNANTNRPDIDELPTPMEMFQQLRDLQAQLRATQEELRQAKDVRKVNSHGHEGTAGNYSHHSTTNRVEPVVERVPTVPLNAPPVGELVVNQVAVADGGPAAVLPIVAAPANSFQYGKFKKCGGEEFDGTLDAVGCMEWLDNIEVVFESFDCPEDKKVLCATRMLRKGAKDWWKGTTVSLTPDVRAAITWDIFRQKFLDEYCGTREKRLLEKEFLSLKKGDKAVAEYARSFMEKLKFAGHLVPTEEAKIAAYTDGLPASYRGLCRQHVTLTDAIRESKKIEDDFKAEKMVVKFDDKNSGLKRKNEEVSGSDKRFKSGSEKDENNKKKGEWCDRCKSRHTGHCTAATLRCNKCAGFGHLYRNCPDAARCFRCKETGHEIANCPQKAGEKKDEGHKGKA